MGCCISSKDQGKQKTLVADPALYSMGSYVISKDPGRQLTSVTDHALYLGSLFKNPINNVTQTPIFGLKDRLSRNLLHSTPTKLESLLEAFNMFLVEVSYSLEKTMVISI